MEHNLLLTGQARHPSVSRRAKACGCIFAVLLALTPSVQAASADAQKSEPTASPAKSAGDQAILGAVNPELRPMGKAMLRAQRAGVKYRPPAPPPLPQGVVEQRLPSRAGAPPVRVYVVGSGKKEAAASLRGAILYIHGGGFVGGDARDNLRALQDMAQRLDCVIVTVQYRLAPDTRFPGPVEDAYSALKWVHDQAPAFGVDRRRIVLLGESAGGGLAAMLALMARDRGEVPVAYQALIYPMLDDRTGSSRAVPPHVGALVWTAADNRKGWEALIGQKPGARTVPKGSVPAREADLSRLPPTFIGVGSIDLFVEEDIDYARRLINAGVPTELLVVPGGFHGFQLIAPKAAVSQQFNAAIEAALARALTQEEK